MRNMLICLLLGFSLTANAANWLAFKNSIIERYNDQDLELLFDTLARALNDNSDGQALAWNNDKTSSSGSIRPIKTFRNEGLKCRLTEIINRFKQQSSKSEYTFCQFPGNGWKFLDATTPAVKNPAPAGIPQQEAE